MTIGDHPAFGVIGGTGIYEMEGITILDRLELNTPFGPPSSPLVIGDLADLQIVFLARHGLGHSLLPSEVNYRANIAAFKMLGVDRLVSISACGSLRVDFAPGDIVVPDQLFDWTHTRERSFFGEGLVAHVSAPAPFCPDLSLRLAESAARAGARVHAGGTSITIEGPRFSTRAESNVFRSWGMSLVGMTTAPEAFLAREAEMCYAVMAHVTDYDVWHLEETPVSVGMVLETLNANTRLAQAALVELGRSLGGEWTCACSDALHDAFITRRQSIPPETLARLRPIVGRYFP
ncbi:MAG: S-methyl-5'-thioadenosine phosphorylase [Anaerolineales bacterium]|nr:S-methyl-5'-thioadenosine phosphorylase [Anaerolineales bacterium]